MEPDLGRGSEYCHNNKDKEDTKYRDDDDEDDHKAVVMISCNCLSHRDSQRVNTGNVVLYVDHSPLLVSTGQLCSVQGGYQLQVILQLLHKTTVTGPGVLRHAHEGQAGQDGEPPHGEDVQKVVVERKYLK